MALEHPVTITVWNYEEPRLMCSDDLPRPRRNHPCRWNLGLGYKSTPDDAVRFTEQHWEEVLSR
jgi:hypothetical protein